MMQKLWNGLGFAAVLAVICAGVWLLDRHLSAQTMLNHFHFSTSEAEMAKQLGVEPSDSMKVEFSDGQYTTHTLEEFDVSRTRRHGVERWAFNLDCWSSRVSRGGMQARAKAMWHGPATGYSTVDFDTPEGSLSIDPDRCSVSGDNLTSPEVANAFLPVAVYVIYGEPMPTAAQIAMINATKKDGPAPGSPHAAREN